MIPRSRCVGRALALVAAPMLLAVRPVAADDEEALRASLARDRAALIELIRRPRVEARGPLAEDPTLREIAERMPRTQEALRRRAPRPEATR